MKLDRLLGIIMLLLQQDKITAPELARRFEVSRRTISRDIEAICQAGIPLVTTQGFGGGIAIAEGYKIDKRILTQEELHSIVSGLQGLDSVSQTACLGRLLDKLAGGEWAVAQNVLIIDLASHYQGTLVPKMDLIKEAAQSRRVITFQYYTEKGAGPRSIEPYRLVFKWSDWYVLGYCLDRQDFRLFKLNRLWQLQGTETAFAPRDIPAEALRFDRFFAGESIHLQAVFHESQKHRLIEEYGVGCYAELSEGGLLFAWDFVSYEHMRQWVLSFGDSVEVLAPERLREDRLAQAQNIIKAAKEHDR